MIKKLKLYYNTLKHLRRKQIAYRLWYFLRHRWRKSIGFSYKFVEDTLLPIASGTVISINAVFDPSITAFPSFSKGNSFTFLNLTKKFDKDIQWDFAEYGKLWTYNLNYFDFLNQNEADSLTKITEYNLLISDFIQKLPYLKNAVEPFPISLRGINWIKYFSRNNIQNPVFDQSLFCQYQILVDNLEYHLLGNHLLENGFSLLFGAIYFQNNSFLQKANKILTDELNEQILTDGAHFELCPMYHKIMLFRVLDSYNLLIHNNLTESETAKARVYNLSKFLFEKATIMLGWLQNMTYSDGSTPHFGDSTEGIAPSSKGLFEYAERLNIPIFQQPLSTSGFRKLKNEHFELIAKIGQIGPDYIPGHAHADSLSFELRIKGKPILIDTGISTYEANERRLLERSTSSHNTVTVNDKNSSEVWSSFRVGKRAKTTILKDTPTELSAEQDGFKELGIRHKRKFVVNNAQSIDIFDETGSGVESKAFLHFAPDLLLKLDNNKVQFEGGNIQFFIKEKDNLKQKSIELVDYFYPPQYNSFLKAQKAIITFDAILQTRITID